MSNFFKKLILRILTSSLLLILPDQTASADKDYYGKLVGSLKTTELNIKISGQVYTTGDNKLLIKDFTYDGSDPIAYFWMGRSNHDNIFGDPVTYQTKGSTDGEITLKKFTNEALLLNIPCGLTHSSRLLTVWSSSKMGFSDEIRFNGVEIPSSKIIGPFTSTKSGVGSGKINILDTKTIEIPHFLYDGKDQANFWAGKGSQPSNSGTKVANPDNSFSPLEMHDGRKTVKIKLPDGLTIFDIEYFALWSSTSQSSLGFVNIPTNLNLPVDIPGFLQLSHQEPCVEDADELGDGLHKNPKRRPQNEDEAKPKSSSDPNSITVFPFIWLSITFYFIISNRQSI